MAALPLLWRALASGAPSASVSSLRPAIGAALSSAGAGAV